MQKPFQRYLTVTKAAERLGCTPQNVRWLLARGRLSGVLVTTRLWMVEEKSVKAYAAEKAI